MYLYYIFIGGNKRRYFIETHKGQSIAYFDDFDTAATVLRYLKGSNLAPEEREVAHRAMYNFDHKKEVTENDTEQRKSIASPTDTAQ